FDWIRSDSDLTWTERKVNMGGYDTTGGRFTRPAEGTQWSFDDSGTFSSGILAHSNDGWRSGRWSPTKDGAILGSGYDNFRVPDGPVGANESCINSTPSTCNFRSLTFGKSGGTSSRIQENNTLV